MAAQANVSVPESSTASTLFVSPQEFRVLSSDSNSVVMDYSAAIGQPTSWNEDTQRIAIEIAITEGGADTSVVFRNNTANCLVDLSSSANSNVFGETATAGSNTITGVTSPIFVLNDRTPQLSIHGPIDDVLTAIQRVQISCSTHNDLRNKYVRIGAVPAEAAGACGNSDTRCEELYYLFSTQRYYRSACTNVNVNATTCGGATTAGTNVTSEDTRIRNLRARGEAITISVDGSANSGATRGGWVATLSTRDEILLTNALGLISMIGTTDMEQTSWNWNTTAWGTTTGTTTCASSEGNFFWLGPDNWCQRIPARNADVGGGSRFWRLGSSNQWEATNLAGMPANGGIDLTSGTRPTEASWTGTTNGKGFSHFWAGNSSGIAEPNNSFDFVYGGYNAGDGEPGWDDAQAAANTRLYIEFCSPAQTCTPPDAAVASTEILPDQRITLRKATNKIVDAQSNWLFLPELSFGESVTANIVVCVSETSTSTFELRFSALVTGTIETSSLISGSTVTLRSDSMFESAANAGQILIFEGPRAAALTVFNGGSAVSSPLRVWKPLGNYFSGSERIWVRVVARSAIGRPLSNALCGQVAAANSWVISVRPYLLQQTARQGDVATKN
jgi:hypothetical protein